MEPYGLFKRTLEQMSVEQPQFYGQLTGLLSPEEQQVLKEALATADTIQQQQLVQQQEQHAGAQQQVANGAA